MITFDTIPKPEKPYLQFVTEGGTSDIVKTVTAGYEEHKEELREWAKQFPRTRAGLESLYNTVKKHIKYVEDQKNPTYKDVAKNIQVIQSPAMLWEDKEVGGDCKSHSIFVGAALYGMGIDFIIRFVSYDPKDKAVTHVYCHALLDGQEYNMDTVYYGFDEEKPYKHKKDFKKMAAIYKIGATLTRGHILSDIPNSIVSEGWGDVSNFSKRELLARLYQERNQILGMSERALIHRNYNEQVLYSLSISKSRDLDAPAFPKYEGIAGNWFSEQWQKLVNWMVKGADGFAPYFLYQFLPAELDKGAEVIKRMAAQSKILDWVLKVTKIDPLILKEIIYNGILKKLKASPENIFDSVLRAPPGTIGFIDPVTLSALIPLIIDGVNVLIKLVQEIATLFNGNKEIVRSELTEENASDIRLLVPTDKPVTDGFTNWQMLAMVGLFGGLGYWVLKK